MLDLRPGTEVGIPCEVRPGAFSQEFLITVETETGPVSGFVREEEVRSTPTGERYVCGIVKEVNADTVTVWLRGSFFTTTGLAYLSRNWANSHLADVAFAH